MPGTAAPPEEAFADGCRRLGFDAGQCAEKVRTCSRQLLLHCNLLLDAEAHVHKCEGHVAELDALVSAGHAVEVCFQWKLEAQEALKRGLAGLALRLELYARQ